MRFDPFANGNDKGSAADAGFHMVAVHDGIDLLTHLPQIAAARFPTDGERRFLEIVSTIRQISVSGSPEPPAALSNVSTKQRRR